MQLHNERLLHIDIVVLLSDSYLAPIKTLLFGAASQVNH
jgi:hypothetical protein